MSINFNGEIQSELLLTRYCLAWIMIEEGTTLEWRAVYDK